MDRRLMMCVWLVKFNYPSCLSYVLYVFHFRHKIEPLNTFVDFTPDFSRGFLYICIINIAGTISEASMGAHSAPFACVCIILKDGWAQRTGASRGRNQLVKYSCLIFFTWKIAKRRQLPRSAQQIA